MPKAQCPVVNSVREQLIERLKTILSNRGMSFADLENTVGREIRFYRCERGKRTSSSVDLLLEYAQSLGLSLGFTISRSSVDGSYPCTSTEELNGRIRRALAREISYREFTLEHSKARIQQTMGIKYGSNALTGLSSFRCKTYRVPDVESSQEWPDDFVSTEIVIHFFSKFGARVEVQVEEPSKLKICC